MTDPIIIDLRDLTTGITTADLGIAMAFTSTKAISLQKISKLSDIQGAVVGDPIYSLAAMALTQKPIELYVLGIDATSQGDDDAKAQAILTALTASGIPFYYLATDIVAPAQVDEVNKYMASRSVGIHLAEEDMLGTIDDAVAHAASYATESCVLYKHPGKILDAKKSPAYMHAAMMGKMSTVAEGTAPWYYQSLNGVPSSAYSGADIDKLYNGYVNTMWSYMKRVETWGGFTTKGTYVDFKILKDWTYIRIKEAVASVIHTDIGIHLSDGDLGLITNAIKGVIGKGKSSGVYVDATVITPRRSEISVLDRQQRKVTGFEVYLEFAGFAEKVGILIITGV